MLQWFSEYSDTLNVVTNVGMLLVWLAYLHIFLLLYRRQTTPTILITRGGGSTLDARCLLSNMSSDVIHLQSLVCTIDESGASGTTSVNDIDELSAKPAGYEGRGLLKPGEWLDVGRFGDLLQLLRGCSGKTPTAESSDSYLRIQVVAAYGSEDLLVSAKRTFDIIQRDNGAHVRPRTVETEQVRSIIARRRLRSMIERYWDEDRSHRPAERTPPEPSSGGLVADVAAAEKPSEPAARIHT